MFSTIGILFAALYAIVFPSTVFKLKLLTVSSAKSKRRKETDISHRSKKLFHESPLSSLILQFPHLFSQSLHFLPQFFDAAVAVC